MEGWSFGGDEEFYPMLGENEGLITSGKSANNFTNMSSADGMEARPQRHFIG